MSDGEKKPRCFGWPFVRLNLGAKLKEDVKAVGLAGMTTVKDIPVAASVSGRRQHNLDAYRISQQELDLDT